VTNSTIQSTTGNYYKGFKLVGSLTDNQLEEEAVMVIAGADMPALKRLVLNDNPLSPGMPLVIVGTIS
jgi:hypothetical protein